MMDALPPLIQVTDDGLYCAAGDFYVDPWRPVGRAVITHAHGDHARRGSRQYLTACDGRHVLQRRMDNDATIDTLDYGESLDIGGVRVSLHPAGHILGSAQVRIEHRGEVAVISGDYKTDADATCRPFEPVRCHTFVTESTFGLPIYRWPRQQDVFDDVNRWWQDNRDAGRVSVVFAYSLGKAQRLLAGLDPGIAPIFCHGAVAHMNRAYRETGVELPETEYAGRGNTKTDWRGALVVAPPSAQGTPWLRKFGEVSTGFASGWMTIRGARRRRSVDRGFVLSDHVDWPGVLSAIEATGAERVLVTHGQVATLVRWLREQGLESDALATLYEGERDDASDDTGWDESADAAGGEAENEENNDNSRGVETAEAKR